MFVISSDNLTGKGETAYKETESPVCQELGVRAARLLPSGDQPDDQDDDVEDDHADQSFDEHRHVKNFMFEFLQQQTTESAPYSLGKNNNKKCNSRRRPGLTSGMLTQSPVYYCSTAGDKIKHKRWESSIRKGSRSVQVNKYSMEIPLCKITRTSGSVNSLIVSLPCLY